MGQNVESVIEFFEKVKYGKLPSHRRHYLDVNDTYRIFAFNIRETKTREPILFKTVAKSAEEAIRNIESTFHTTFESLYSVDVAGVSKEDTFKHLDLNSFDV